MYMKLGIMLIFISFIMIFFSFYMMFSMLNYLIVFNFFMFNQIDGGVLVFIDWVSMSFMSIVTMISGLVICYSYSYMSFDYNKSGFLWLVLLFLMSMLLMIMMPSMWSIMLGWDGLGVVSYCLVIYYSSVISYNSGMVTVLINRMGDMGILVSIVFFFNFGSWNFVTYMMSSEFFNIIIIMIMLGAFTKSAQIPFSAWLPMAMAAPTPVSSLVHSSTLVTAGVYLIIRFNLYFSGGVFSSFLLMISLMTMMLSGIGALLETDIKKIIAMSTLSQLGMMMFSLSLGYWEISYFHLLMHAMFSAMLFLCAGVIIHGMSGKQDIRLLGEFINVSMLIKMMMMVGSLSLIGFPFLSGFYSSDLLLEVVNMYNYSLFIMFMIVFSVMSSLMYSFRLVYYVFMMGSSNMSFIFYGEDDEMVIPIMLMGVFVIMMGSLFMWLIFDMYWLSLYKMEMKLFPLILMMLSTFIMYYIYMYFWSMSVFSYWLFYLVGMWGMFYGSSRSMLWVFSFSKVSFDLIDIGWMENIEGMGMSNFMTIYGMLLLKMSSGIKYFFVLFILLFIIMMM
uniref:NADH dehydrogenase subunit 5 n=1 Tax=Uroobovella oviformis TaxID=3106009 RepID=UPI002E7AAD78|nr:NADH dehydrogenase subunit 5 [Uroobovella oviformis]WPV72078.1 NADH dehydrogenase subunit 5 [Uroobovella oviformis]